MYVSSRCTPRALSSRDPVCHILELPNFQEGKGKTLEVVKPHTSNGAGFHFASSMVLGGVTAVQTTHILRHALKLLLAIIVVPECVTS